MVLIKSKMLSFALCALQAVQLASAYPTKEVVQLVDPSKQDGGDGGCLEGTHYIQVDTINNLDKKNTNYSITFRQVSLECGQPFTSDSDPFSITGTFASGDIEPDTKGRSQLNLYFCAPYGNYRIDMEITGDFDSEEGKRIGWEIEDGQTQNHIWDTYNVNTEEKYSPTKPGKYSWPLEGETDAHMANFFVGLDPASPACDGFEGGEGETGGNEVANVAYAELGCFSDSPASRLFAATGEVADGSSLDVAFCANLCFDMGYPYCGVENSDECYCGASLPETIDTRAISSDFCNLACTGNAAVLCGGFDAIAVYALDGATDGNTGGTTGGTDGSTGGTDSTPTVDGGPEGCFADSKTARVLDSAGIYKNHEMTHKMCQEHCATKGVEFYGLEFDHECFCGNGVDDKFKIEDSKCDMPCSGDANETCGGRDAISVHYL